MAYSESYAAHRQKDAHVVSLSLSVRRSVDSTPCLKKTSHLWLAVTLTHVNGF